jgi:hypothetical protein
MKCVLNVIGTAALYFTIPPRTKKIDWGDKKVRLYKRNMSISLFTFHYHDDRASFYASKREISVCNGKQGMERNQKQRIRFPVDIVFGGESRFFPARRLLARNILVRCPTHSELFVL